MKYIKISYLDLQTIPRNYTFFLELNDDNSFTGAGAGISKDKINKYDNPKDPDNTFWEWIKDISFNEEEVKKYKIDKNEFMVAQQEVAKDQRKN